MCIVDIDSGELEFPEELPGFPYEQEQSLSIIFYAFAICNLTFYNNSIEMLIMERNEVAGFIVFSQ